MKESKKSEHVLDPEPYQNDTVRSTAWWVATWDGSVQYRVLVSEGGGGTTNTQKL